MKQFTMRTDKIIQAFYEKGEMDEDNLMFIHESKFQEVAKSISELDEWVSEYAVWMKDDECDWEQLSIGFKTLEEADKFMKSYKPIYNEPMKIMEMRDVITPPKQK